MLFQQATPDTAGYMIAGYAVLFGVLLVYLTSFFVRFKKLRQDLDILEEFDVGD